MSSLPKRPWPYIALLLVTIMVALTFWMFQALNSREIQRAVANRKQAIQAKGQGQGTNSSPMTGADLSSAAIIAPEIREMAAPLNADDGDPQKDLQTLAELMKVYSRIYEGNPIGENMDITKAMTGENEKRLVTLPPDHPAIRNGQIIDRWGTPYWFHPISGKQMEIRSAGPDKELFTPDDIVPEGQSSQAAEAGDVPGEGGQN